MRAAIGRHSSSACPVRPGVTLVELLVVVGLIAVLLGLTLPAVQRVREASARAQCQNNLRQIGLGWLGHQAAHGHFPTGGGNFATVPYYLPITFLGPGAPAVGGPRPTDQRASWMYQLLPHVGEEPL